MKIIKLITVIALSVAAANTVQAQQEEKTAVKPLPAALTKSPAADKPSAEYAAKQIAADAVPAAPSPSNTTAKTEDMKAVEIKAADRKVQEVKNIDIPKTSTIIKPEKKAEPATKPKPMLAPVIEG